MFFRKKQKEVKVLIKRISELNEFFTRSNLMDLIYISGNKKEIFKRNIIAGIARGVGIGIGVTIITAIIILLLQKLVKLNIPVIRRVYYRHY